MKRAQSMAQAAWSRPGLRFSSWSCVGPRRRPLSNQLNNIDCDNSNAPSSTQEAAAAEPFLSASEVSTRSTSEKLELPVSSSEGLEWTTGSPADAILHGGDDQVDDCDDILEHERHENHMTEVELWQQLEQELYDEAEAEDGDVVKEMKEEEAAAIAEISDNESESSVPNTKDMHRFFPPGKIMHIVTLLPEEEEEVVHESESNSNSNSNLEQPTVTKVGIFLTRRSLYSKLRLSQTMISDHFMPVYRRQIEKLIKELEEDISNTLHCSEEKI